MIQTQVSGSTFDDKTIRKLNAFSFELDIILALRNLRIFSFEERFKYLLDVKTNKLILVRRGTNCYIEKIESDNIFVSVGSCLFSIKKEDIREIEI